MPLFGLLLVAGCEKEQAAPIPSQTDTSIEFRSPAGQIELCHYSEEDGTWQVISVDKRSVPFHRAHGDYFPDSDGDGYTAEGACTGSMDDCDDNNADVHPGAKEICGNGIDDNCDGNIDEDCVCTVGKPILSGGQSLYVNTEDLPGPYYNWYDAITACEDLVTADGCTEWFLPSKEELNDMYLNKHLLGLDNDYDYWSSTQYNTTNAWWQYFGDGLQDYATKDASRRCRCVRR